MHTYRRYVYAQRKVRDIRHTICDLRLLRPEHTNDEIGKKKMQVLHFRPRQPVISHNNDYAFRRTLHETRRSVGTVHRCVGVDVGVDVESAKAMSTLHRQPDTKTGDSPQWPRPSQTKTDPRGGPTRKNRPESSMSAFSNEKKDVV